MMQGDLFSTTPTDTDLAQARKHRCEGCGKVWRCQHPAGFAACPHTQHALCVTCAGKRAKEAGRA